MIAGSDTHPICDVDPIDIIDQVLCEVAEDSADQHTL